MQSTDLIETCIWNKQRFSKCKEEIIKQQYNKKIQKMINFDDVKKEETNEHHPNWLEIPDHPYRILIIGGSGSGKTNSLFNLINQ